jgi:parallel beta-helix repeat protein
VRVVIAAALVAVAVTLLIPKSTSARIATRSRAHPACTSVIAPGDGLQRFMRRMHAGESACLAPGDYNIHRLTLSAAGTKRSPITLRSLDRNRPATLHGVVWLAASGSYWIVEDLRIDGRNKWNLPSPIVNGSHSIWRRDDVSNVGSGDGTQPYAGGICFNLGQVKGYGYAADTTIAQSRIHDCGVATNHNHGIYVVATSGRTIIRDNWIFRNGDRGIQLYPAGDNVTITHNVIDGNGSGIIFSGHGSLTSRDAAVTRNIISNSRDRWNVESWYPDGTPIGTGNLVSENCLWADSSNRYYNSDGGIAPALGFVIGGGNVVQRPQFAGARQGNFKLWRQSGCKGFGPVVDPPLWPH